MKVPCILCGRVTERLVSEFWGVHRECEDLSLFERDHSARDGGKAVYTVGTERG